MMKRYFCSHSLFTRLRLCILRPLYLFRLWLWKDNGPERDDNNSATSGSTTEYVCCEYNRQKYEHISEQSIAKIGYSLFSLSGHLKACCHAMPKTLQFWRLDLLIGIFILMPGLAFLYLEPRVRRIMLALDAWYLLRACSQSFSL